MTEENKQKVKEKYPEMDVEVLNEATLLALCKQIDSLNSTSKNLNQHIKLVKEYKKSYVPREYIPTYTEDDLLLSDKLPDAVKESLSPAERQTRDDAIVIKLREEAAKKRQHDIDEADAKQKHEEERADSLDKLIEERVINPALVQAVREKMKLFKIDGMDEEAIFKTIDEAELLVTPVADRKVPVTPVASTVVKDNGSDNKIEETQEEIDVRMQNLVANSTGGVMGSGSLDLNKVTFGRTK